VFTLCRPHGAGWPHRLGRDLPDMSRPYVCVACGHVTDAVIASHHEQHATQNSSPRVNTDLLSS
jgi:hypothetical protein